MRWRKGGLRCYIDCIHGKFSDCINVPNNNYLLQVSVIIEYYLIFVVPNPPHLMGIVPSIQTVKVIWSIPTPVRGPILQYNVEYNTSVSSMSINRPGTAKTANIAVNSKAGSRHTLRIRAQTSAGWGKFAIYHYDYWPIGEFSYFNAEHIFQLIAELKSEASNRDARITMRLYVYMYTYIYISVAFNF